MSVWYIIDKNMHNIKIIAQKVSKWYSGVFPPPFTVCIFAYFYTECSQTFKQNLKIHKSDASWTKKHNNDTSFINLLKKVMQHTFCIIETILKTKKAKKEALQFCSFYHQIISIYTNTILQKEKKKKNTDCI